MKLEFHPSGERLLGVAGSVRHSLAEDLLFCHKDSVIDGGGAFGTLFAFTLMRASPIGWGA